MRNLIIILFTMIANSVLGQQLDGKWLLKDMGPGDGKKDYPGFQLLEIQQDTVAVYLDFSLEQKSSSLTMADGYFWNNNKKNGTYQIVDDHHLKWFVNGKANNKDAVFECDFYRLQPTRTTLTKEEIEKLVFVLTENGHETKFEFNKELWSKERLAIFNYKEGEKYMIEQIDSTFFVSIYSHGKRDASIPIREVSTEFLKLYAIPTGPMEMIAYRKK